MPEKENHQFDYIFSSIRRVYNGDDQLVQRADGSRPYKLRIGSGLFVTYNSVKDSYDLSAGAGGDFVVESRTIATTDPLYGGGDLSANRTFSLALHGDGSLVADGVPGSRLLRVGVISDLQHGQRSWEISPGGGLTHPEATNTAEGFMPRSDKAELMRQRAFTDPAMTVDFEVDDTKFLYRIDPTLGADILVTLPSTAMLQGRQVMFKLLDNAGMSQLISIAADATDTIDGNATFNFNGSQWESLVLYCARDTWYIVSHYIP
jgi:hypothetical protein